MSTPATCPQAIGAGETLPPTQGEERGIEAFLRTRIPAGAPFWSNDEAAITDRGQMLCWIEQYAAERTVSTPLQGEVDNRFWLIVHEPGLVPELKGPWEHVGFKSVMRDFIAARPLAYLTVLTVDEQGVPDVQHGPEALQMADGRSMGVGRRHNQRTREAHRAALTPSAAGTILPASGEWSPSAAVQTAPVVAEKQVEHAAGELLALAALIERPPLDDVELTQDLALRAAAAIRVVINALDDRGRSAGAGHSDTHGEAMEMFAHLNCPACGGSGHIDDVTVEEAGQTGEVEPLDRALAYAFIGKLKQSQKADVSERLGIKLDYSLPALERDKRFLRAVVDAQAVGVLKAAVFSMLPATEAAALTSLSENGGDA